MNTKRFDQGGPLLALVLAAALAGCGGGGGSPGAVGGGPIGGGGGGTTNPAEPTVRLTIVDGSGNAVSTLAGGQSASLRATVLTATGRPAVGAIVQFTAGTSGLVEFTPATGSALTDANGVAVVTVKPASVTAAGAVAIKATSEVDGKAATASSNIAVGAAPLTVGALSFSPAPTGRLPAFSTLSLNIPVTSGGQPVSSVSGLNLTSLCVGDGTATLVAGAIANGVQLATYTNNGCLRGRDIITVSIGNSTQTIGVDVDPANIGAIQFSSTSMSGTSIVLKGSGGLGRSESAQVTFRVVDQHNNGLPGVDVNFSATTYTGGLTVTPARATTDAAGNVSTMVSSGTIPTPVRVIAEATRNGVKMSGLSDTLTISTGLPIQRSMSMSARELNIEGDAYDGVETDVTVLLADQYGNPVSDNTAINFVTEGGAVGSSAQGACTTVNGGCTVKLRSQNFRPADGRVTVLAYLQGIENFTDLNGDGQFTCASWTGPGVFRPLVDECTSSNEFNAKTDDMGDAFLDTRFDGVYNAAQRDLPFPFGGTTYKAGGDGKWGVNYIRSSIEVTFSGSDAFLIRQVCATDGTCSDWPRNDPNEFVINGVAGPGCAAVPLTFRLVDRLNNPLPANTTVTASDVNKLTLSSFFPDRVASTNRAGGTIHKVVVNPDSSCTPGNFVLKVTTPKGNSTGFPFKSN
jgi:hypothetical protein